MAKMRLDKIISSTGEYSRKQAKELIAAGKVCIDGSIAKNPEEKFDADIARITVNGEDLDYSEYIYIMLNKPAGYITSTEDPGDITVMALLPEKYRKRKLFPVGRLDKDSEGLLLITDNGPLAHDLLSPKKHVDKVYSIIISGGLNESDILQLEKGITLNDGYNCLPAKLEIAGDDKSHGYITIHEGKFHQVKRMMASLGKPVIYLKRIQMGPLILDDTLNPGEFRKLNNKEIEELLNH